MVREVCPADTSPRELNAEAVHAAESGDAGCEDICCAGVIILVK